MLFHSCVDFPIESEATRPGWVPPTGLVCGLARQPRVRVHVFFSSSATVSSVGPDSVPRPHRGLISSSENENNHPSLASPEHVGRIKGNIESRSLKDIKYTGGGCGQIPSSRGQEMNISHTTHPHRTRSP